MNVSVLLGGVGGEGVGVEVSFLSMRWWVGGTEGMEMKVVEAVGTKVVKAVVMVETKVMEAVVELTESMELMMQSMITPMSREHRYGRWWRQEDGEGRAWWMLWLVPISRAC